MENNSVSPDQVTFSNSPVYAEASADKEQKSSSLATSAAKTGGNIFMVILKIIFGGVKAFFRFFFALGFMAKMLFLLILVFFMGVSFLFGYFVGRNNYDQKIKDQLEDAQIKLENIEKEIRN